MVEIGNDQINPESYPHPRVVPPEERPGFRVKRETISRAEQFVEYIMAGMDQVTAYRKAGYKASTDKAAKIGAAKVLKRPEVVNLMRTIKGQVAKDISVTAKKVVDELARVAFSDIRDYVNIAKKNLKLVVESGPNGEEEEVWEEVVELKVKTFDEMRNTAAVARIKQGRYGIEVSLWDKTKALEMLGKYLQLFDDPDPSKKALEVDLTNLTDEELQQYYALSNKVTTKAIAS